MLGVMDAECKPTHEIPEPLRILPCCFPNCLPYLFKFSYALLFRLGLLKLSKKLLFYLR
uniref:Uncharacterized protein n=1 Tax=Picea glauca TaxID=3330 RepID=A0A117NJ26_PICGL|nr:hypothetical protein ABT39_MTgene731 [Picea glauca]